MCNLISWRSQQDKAKREYEESRRVTVGMKGKVSLFTQRPAGGEEGYIRVDGKTVSGYVPHFGRGGKVFYAYASLKNARLAA